MATLGDQAVRERYKIEHSFLDAFLQDVKALSKKHSISVEAVIAAKHALELKRQNDIRVQDGDFRDEHAAGYGDLISKVADAIAEKA